MTERKRLMLIDGHALAFRAFHALSSADLRTSGGEPTYAVYGFLQILLTMVQEQRPHYLAVAFDVGRTFRDDMYAEYKAGRAETPEEFHPQLDRIKEAVRALNMPIYTAEGYEADDVIGTLARQATSEELDTIILTGDTDTLQLVDEHVKVLMANPYGQKTTTTLYDEGKVRERYKGLQPGQLADMRGLKGDKSDNIPGVNGIGEAGAIALLNQFGSIEALYERLGEAPTRYRKKLEGQRDDALFSKNLSVIVCDAPVKLDIQAAQIDDYERDTILALFQQLEFGKSLLDKLPRPLREAEIHHLPTTVPQSDEDEHGSLQLSMFDTPDPAQGNGHPAPVSPLATASGTYRSVTSDEELREVLDALTTAPGFAFDIESTGLEALTSDIVGISLAVRSGEGWYIPIGHREGQQLPRQHVLDALRGMFANLDKPKYAHNAKFDIELLHQAGVLVEGLAFDTQLVARLLGKRSGLKELAFYELQPPLEMAEISTLIGQGKKQITFDRVPIEQATPYAAADADATLRLTTVFQQQLTGYPQLQELFTRLELPLVPILAAMERAGIGLDVEYMRRLSDRLAERIAGIEEEIYSRAGERFNINSGLQLSDILFQKLHMPTSGLNKTATGRYSLTADALEALAARLAEEDHEHVGILLLVLQYRQLAKLKSTYVDALPELVNPRTGRIHTSYNQLGAATGRLSSANPNLQNIPVRTDEGSEIRRAFVAAPGHVFIAADYSQIELRVLAHICQDDNLLQVFREGQDIHAATAAQLFGIAPGDVSKHQRRIAKSVVFGVIYGISSFGLAQRTDLSRSEAQALINALFERFPGIRAYIDNTLEQGRRDGYVQSLFGRRRSMPELNSKGPRRQAAEREAINAPIQATAADIMKLAMIQVANEIKRRTLKTRILLQVHDELILEAPDGEVQEVQQMLREVMENVYTLRVPLQVDVEKGQNWEEMEDVQ